MGGPQSPRGAAEVPSKAADEVALIAEQEDGGWLRQASTFLDEAVGGVETHVPMEVGRRAPQLRRKAPTKMKFAQADFGRELIEHDLPVQIADDEGHGSPNCRMDDGPQDLREGRRGGVVFGEAAEDPPLAGDYGVGCSWADDDGAGLLEAQSALGAVNLQAAVRDLQYLEPVVNVALLGLMDAKPLGKRSTGEASARVFEGRSFDAASVHHARKFANGTSAVEDQRMPIVAGFGA